MNKEVKITKQQFIASIQLAATMLKGKGTRKTRKSADTLNSFATEVGPYLEEDWFVNINLEDYENAMYKGEDNE